MKQSISVLKLCQGSSKQTLFCSPLTSPQCDEESEQYLNHTTQNRQTKQTDGPVSSVCLHHMVLELATCALLLYSLGLLCSQVPGGSSIQLHPTTCDIKGFNHLPTSQEMLSDRRTDGRYYLCVCHESDLEINVGLKRPLKSRRPFNLHNGQDYLLPSVLEPRHPLHPSQ